MPVVRVDAAFERVHLDETSWVDVTRDWLAEPDELFTALRDGVAWQASRLFRYDHWVEERRLGAMWRPGSPLPHPAPAEVHKALQSRYGVRFNGFGLSLALFCFRLVCIVTRAQCVLNQIRLGISLWCGTLSGCGRCLRSFWRVRFRTACAAPSQCSGKAVIVARHAEIVRLPLACS